MGGSLHTIGPKLETFFAVEESLRGWGLRRSDPPCKGNMATIQKHISSNKGLSEAFTTPWVALKKKLGGSYDTALQDLMGPQGSD